MADRLTELGIENALTRDSDVTLDSTTRPKTAQSLFGTGSDVILVSNHINAGGGEGSCGKLTFFEIKKRFIYI